jgi:hypothetical protein
MGHGSVVADAVLLLQVAPFLREFASEEVFPTDRALLLEKSLVARWVQSRVDGIVTEPTEKAFTKNVQKDRIEKGVDGLKERPDQIAAPGAPGRREAL